MKWAIAGAVFAAMAWGLYRAVKKLDDPYSEGGTFLLTFAATAGVMAMLSILFLVKEI